MESQIPFLDIILIFKPQKLIFKPSKTMAMILLVVQTSLII